MAVAAGAGGLAIRTGDKSASSGGGARSGSSGSSGSPGSFGSRSRRDNKPAPIIVEVYMGDRSNRAAAMQLEKQLTARIKKAS